MLRGWIYGVFILSVSQTVSLLPQRNIMSDYVNRNYQTIKMHETHTYIKGSMEEAQLKALIRREDLLKESTTVIQTCILIRLFHLTKITHTVICEQLNLNATGRLVLESAVVNASTYGRIALLLMSEGYTRDTIPWQKAQYKALITWKVTYDTKIISIKLIM